MRIKLGLTVSCLVVPMALALSGCGDKNMLKSISSGSASEEAKVESALYALDKGDYSTAIAELSALAASDERNKYLAGAYIGQAGFNTLDLITKIDDMQSAGTGSSGTKLWNSVSDVFDPANAGELSMTETQKKIGDLENALSVLVTGNPGNYETTSLQEFSNLSDERLFQAGTAASLHSTLLISSVLPNTSGTGNIPLDPAQFDLTNVGSDYFDSGPAAAALTSLNKDINVLHDAVTDVLGQSDETGSLVDKMNDFIQEINGGVAPTPGVDVQITSANLVSYLQKLKNSKI